MAARRLSRKTSQATRIGVAALIALTLATAVATVVNLQSGEAASGPTATASATSDPASTYVFDQIADRALSSGFTAREKTLADVLPNHFFAVGDSTPVTLATGIVFGTVSKVEPGVAYISDAGDGSGTDEIGTEVDFDSVDADWRVIVVTIKVDSALGGISGDSTVSLGLTVDGAADTARIFAGYESMDHIIAVLDGPGDVSFDRDLYSVRQDGLLFGLVADDDSITFPALGAQGDAFIDGLVTKTDVLLEATGPDTVTGVTRAEP